MPHPVTSLNGPALPIERLAIPLALSDIAGTNRARGLTRQINADDDLSAVAAWLARYADVPGTLATYRKESERFLADPQPAWRWVMTSRKKLGRTSPDWQPFAGPLSLTSTRHAMTILNALFAWLVQAGYLEGNPLSLARRRGTKTPPCVTRYLGHELWNVVKAAIEALPTETERDRLHAARCRWLFTVLYLGGPRTAEIVGTTMGAVFCRRDAAGQDRWRIKVCGKGGKLQLVSVTGCFTLGYSAAHLVPFMIFVKILGPVAILSRFNVALSDLAQFAVTRAPIARLRFAETLRRLPEWDGRRGYGRPRQGQACHPLLPVAVRRHDRSGLHQPAGRPAVPCRAVEHFDPQDVAPKQRARRLTARTH